MYLVFSCYNALTNKKIEKIIFIITIFTAVYLSFIYNIDCSVLLIFCNIPVLICYFKKYYTIFFHPKNLWKTLNPMI